MTGERATEELVSELLARRTRVTRQELRDLVFAAHEHGGEFIGASSSGDGELDDWCGTMWFRRPRPKLGGLIDFLVDRGWVVGVFPYGIPAIDRVRIDVRNNAGLVK